jgi:hypothetical protein
MTIGIKQQRDYLRREKNTLKNGAQIKFSEPDDYPIDMMAALINHFSTEPGVNAAFLRMLEQDGKMYLMPESGEDRSLLLYEAVEFPRKWKRVKALRRDVDFADTTPIVGSLALTHEVSVADSPKLLLIDLTGQMPDAPAENQDILRSRPAGKPFHLEDRLIRPIQHSWDFDQNYGKSLIFSTVTLEGGICREEPIAEITPDELRYSRPIYLDGMHTYNASTHFEVIDIKTRRFNLLNLAFRVLSKFRRR